MTDCILCKELRPVSTEMPVCGQCCPYPQRAVMRPEPDGEWTVELQTPQGPVDIARFAAYWYGVQYCCAHGIEVVWR